VGERSLDYRKLLRAKRAHDELVGSAHDVRDVHDRDSKVHRMERREQALPDDRRCPVCARICPQSRSWFLNYRGMAYVCRSCGLTGHLWWPCDTSIYYWHDGDCRTGVIRRETPAAAAAFLRSMHGLVLPSDLTINLPRVDGPGRPLALTIMVHERTAARCVF
jgi:hypothetical protein